MPASPPKILSKKYSDWRVSLLACTVGAVFVWACLHFGAHAFWIAPIVIACFVAANAISKQATVDCSRKTVYEHFRAFGLRAARAREFPFSDFRIFVDCHHLNDNRELAYVGLRHCTGRRINLRTFPSDHPNPQREAQEFAWRLSCDTDMEIDDLAV